MTTTTFTHSLTAQQASKNTSSAIVRFSLSWLRKCTRPTQGPLWSRGWRPAAVPSTSAVCLCCQQAVASSDRVPNLHSQPVSHPVSHSVSHSLSQPLSQLVTQSAVQSLSSSLSQPLSHSTSQSDSNSMSHSVSHRRDQKL